MLLTVNRVRALSLCLGLVCFCCTACGEDEGPWEARRDGTPSTPPPQLRWPSPCPTPVDPGLSAIPAPGPNLSEPPALGLTPAETEAVARLLERTLVPEQKDKLETALGLVEKQHRLDFMRSIESMFAEKLLRKVSPSVRLAATQLLAAHAKSDRAALLYVLPGVLGAKTYTDDIVTKLLLLSHTGPTARTADYLSALNSLLSPFDDDKLQRNFVTTLLKPALNGHGRHAYEVSLNILDLVEGRKDTRNSTLLGALATLVAYSPSEHLLVQALQFIGSAEADDRPCLARGIAAVFSSQARLPELDATWLVREMLQRRPAPEQLVIARNILHFLDPEDKGPPWSEPETLGYILKLNPERWSSILSTLAHTVDDEKGLRAFACIDSNLQPATLEEYQRLTQNGTSKVGVKRIEEAVRRERQRRDSSFGATSAGF